MTDQLIDFQRQIKEGIPSLLPSAIQLDPSPKNRDASTVSHAPKRVIDTVLSEKEKKLAVQNALRYLYAPFSSEIRDVCAPNQRLSRKIEASSRDYVDDSK